jgi:hypothetical protein
MTRLHQVKVQILGEVMAKHCVTPEELVGNSRMGDVLAARRDAAVRLKAAGFHPTAIARTLRRDPATIHNYLDSQYRDRKRDRMRARKALNRLLPGVNDTVAAIAAAEGVSPVMLAAEWIAERARYEAEAKARAA